MKKSLRTYTHICSRHIVTILSLELFSKYLAFRNHIVYVPTKSRWRSVLFSSYFSLHLAHIPFLLLIHLDNQEYVITKGLTKHPKDYPDGDRLPHVVVAKVRKREEGER